MNVLQTSEPRSSEGNEAGYSVNVEGRIYLHQKAKHGLSSFCYYVCVKV